MIRRLACISVVVVATACSSSRSVVRSAVTTTTVFTAVVGSSAPAPTNAVTSTTTVAPLAPMATAQSFSVIVATRDWQRAGRSLVTRVYRPQASGRFPVFVWAHGFQASVDYFDPLLRSIARHGFVVVAPTFPLTHSGAAGGGDYNDYVHQPADVSFVISQTLAEFAANVDVRRIAVGGHSLGAVTTRALVSNRCCVDVRVRAAVEIDGSNLAFPNGAVEERGVPLLLIHGDADHTFSVNESRTTFARAKAPKYLVVLRGIGHVPFRITRADAVITSTVVDLLDVALKRDPNAGLRLVRDASVPGFTALEMQP